MRGGKRPGAGAPKGNINAARSGEFAVRGSMTLLAVQSVTGTPAAFPVGWALMAAGYLTRSGCPPHKTKAMIAFLYRYFFEMSPSVRAGWEARGKRLWELSKTIKFNQPQSISEPSTPTRPDSNGPKLRHAITPPLENEKIQ